MKWRGILAALGTAAFVFVLSGAGYAAEGRGYSISPALAPVQVPRAGGNVSYVVEVGNNTSQPQLFRLSVVDFGFLDEQGGVAFLGQPASELEHRYGLASWMKLDRPEVTVAPGSTVKVTATIDNRPSLSPGGHYGAVLATVVSDPSAAAGSKVGIKQVLSSLVLVTKEGDARPDLGVTGQTHNGSWWRIPSQVEVRFGNTGNLHAVPRGVVEVRDLAGRTVARGAINEASSTILPGSFRKYPTKLTDTNSAWLPGRYRIVTTYRYDGEEVTERFVTTMWYAGEAVVWIGGLVGALVAVGLGILVWRLRIRGRQHRRK